MIFFVCSEQTHLIFLGNSREPCRERRCEGRSGGELVGDASTKMTIFHSTYINFCFLIRIAHLNATFLRLILRFHSRHNQGLVSWLTQESINEHRGAGEVVNSPCSSFIDTKPVSRGSCHSQHWSSRATETVKLVTLHKYNTAMHFIIF